MSTKINKVYLHIQRTIKDKSMKKMYLIWAMSILATHLTIRSLDFMFWLSFTAFMLSTVFIAYTWDKEYKKTNNQ
mgnify:CR=1 FL=1